MPQSNLGPLVGSEAEKRRKAKTETQKALTSGFWHNVEARWTDEEKRQTLAQADKARQTVATGIQHARAMRAANAATFSATSLEEMGENDLRRLIQEEMTRAERQQQDWATRSASANRAISFLNNFVEFVGEFSGIIEIVKGADQGYGGAGYTALSVLLAVAVNTKRKDDLVSEALNNLKREYSRMVLLSEIYHTPMMSMYITTVFKLGIEFMQEAISHYSRPTWRRLWDAVVRPPFLLNRKVSEISAAMIQIEKERDTLLTKSVHVLHIKMDHMTENVAQLQGDLDQIHTNDEKKRLVTLRSELLRYLIQPNKTVDDYSRLLNGAFDLPPGLPRFGADQVMQEKAYAAWKNSRSNCMLVVSGRTIADQTSCCWLSPAAIEVASALKREASIDAAYGGVAVVDLYCQKADFMTDKDQATSLGVVVSLLFQLLEANPSTLRDVSKFDSLRQRIAEVDGAGSRGLDVAFGLLSDILGHFDLVYIVLDRVDRIRGDFLRIMLTRLMVSRRNGPKIRAFCVACSNKEGMRKSLKELEEEMDDKNLILFQKDQSRF